MDPISSLLFYFPHWLPFPKYVNRLYSIDFFALFLSLRFIPMGFFHSLDTGAAPLLLVTDWEAHSDKSSRVAVRHLSGLSGHSEGSFIILFAAERFLLLRWWTRCANTKRHHGPNTNLVEYSTSSRGGWSRVAPLNQLRSSNAFARYQTNDSTTAEKTDHVLQTILISMLSWTNLPLIHVEWHKLHVVL